MLVILEIQRLLRFGVLTPLRQSVAFCPSEKNFTLHFLAFLSGFVHKVPIRTLPSKLACQYFKDFRLHAQTVAGRVPVLLTNPLRNARKHT